MGRLSAIGNRQGSSDSARAAQVHRLLEYLYPSFDEELRASEAIVAAHQNPVWQAMCARYSDACEYVSLETLSESKNMFAKFEPVSL
jgi:hypothetical protein